MAEPHPPRHRRRHRVRPATVLGLSVAAAVLLSAAFGAVMTGLTDPLPDRQVAAGNERPTAAAVSRLPARPTSAAPAPTPTVPHTATRTSPTPSATPSASPSRSRRYASCASPSPSGHRTHGHHHGDSDYRWRRDTCDGGDD
ncbi:MAG TPA: hypothetical protein VGN37_22915 [Actinocatenispora sp.]